MCVPDWRAIFSRICGNDRRKREAYLIRGNLSLATYYWPLFYLRFANDVCIRVLSFTHFLPDVSMRERVVNCKHTYNE